MTAPVNKTNQNKDLSASHYSFGGEDQVRMDDSHYPPYLRVSHQYENTINGDIWVDNTKERVTQDYKNIERLKESKPFTSFT